MKCDDFDSKTLNILDAIKDIATNALLWKVNGTFNGSVGYYELLVDPASNCVWHFVFKS